MRIYIGWSGQTSKQVASLLHDSLRPAFNVSTWMSEYDIGEGRRWRDEVANELAKSDFGIICLTPDNLRIPWIHFESGAISLCQDTRLIPFLFGVDHTDLPGPLNQFRATSYVVDKESIRSLFDTIFEAVSNSEITAYEPRDLDIIFKNYGLPLLENLQAIEYEGPEQADSESRIKRVQETVNLTLAELREIRKKILPFDGESITGDQARELADWLRKNPEAVYLHDAIRLGVGHRYALFKCTILTETSMEIEREISVESFETVRELDAFLFSDDSSKFEEPEIKVLGSDRRVNLVKTSNGPDSANYRLVFDPELEYEHKVRYRIREKVTGKALGTGPYGFGWQVWRPTRRLRLRVTFPENLRPVKIRRRADRAKAFGFPESTFLHSETSRLTSPNLEPEDEGQYSLTLDVDKPMTGTVYRMRWEEQTSQQGENE